MKFHELEVFVRLAQWKNSTLVERCGARKLKDHYKHLGAREMLVAKRTTTMNDGGAPNEEDLDDFDTRRNLRCLDVMGSGVGARPIRVFEDYLWLGLVSIMAPIFKVS